MNGTKFCACGGPSWDLRLGDCLEILKSLPDNSVDAVVCDPPYGLSKEPDISRVMQHWIDDDDYMHTAKGFMGKSWDSFVPGPKYWREVFRVLKPGGHALVFGGTRTWDLMSIALRFAGFEIRDTCMWITGQGFPKSLDISKAIDKAEKIERPKGELAGRTGGGDRTAMDAGSPSGSLAGEYFKTQPATDAAKQWEGWGTALKPAFEPICLARKPLEKGLTVAQNVQKWGVGGLNIDGCRIGLNGEKNPSIGRYQSKPQKGNNGWEHSNRGANFNPHSAAKGRFPANVIFSHEPECEDGRCSIYCAVQMLDRQAPKTGAQAPVKRKATPSSTNTDNYKPHTSVGDDGASFRGDSGGASRFFYCAKASTSERNAGLQDRTPEKVNDGRQTPIDNPFQRGETQRRNTHPTVKPVKLMEYLCRLITPPGGIVLDPFMGSGSTGVAARNEGFGFIGIEMSEEYLEIAKRRIGASDG